ncbi:MAG: hypothetical protein IJ507_08950, partial [Clostridia bacterium]|nr:hypothetical protein [Clostridia bacterium]
MKHNKLAALILAILLLMTSVLTLAEPVQTNTPVMINDVRTAFFDETGAYLPVMEENGLVYVPAVATGESLQLDVTADASTLAVNVGGVRAAFFDDTGAYLPPVLINGVVYVPLQAFLNTCNVDYTMEDGAYLITRGAPEPSAAPTAVPTAAPTATPVYGYVPLSKDNFLDFFTIETGSSYPDINYKLSSF